MYTRCRAILVAAIIERAVRAVMWTTTAAVTAVVGVVVGGEEMCGMIGEIHRQVSDTMHKAGQLSKRFPGGRRR